MRILIAGLGSIGRRHLRNLRSLGQEEFVLLRTHTSTLPEDELAGLPTETDVHNALQRWHPDAVIVSNPTSRHLEIATPAAMAGCHLLIEKPVSDSNEGIAGLSRAIAGGGGQVLVGFQFRFHPGLRRVKQLLEEGAIGRALSARVEWGEYLPDWHPWEDYRKGYSARKDLGGGVLLTLCHPFDYLRWLLGEAVDVQARIGALGDLEIDVEDSAEVILSHVSGAVASVHLDYLRRPPCHRLEITGTDGTLRCDLADAGISWWDNGAGVWQTQPHLDQFDRNSMFVDEMKHFLDLALGHAQSVCGLDDGINALQIVLAARRSSTKGCRVDIIH